MSALATLLELLRMTRLPLGDGTLARAGIDR